jgi:hypothetical protein
MEMGGALVKRICILGAKGGVDLKKLEGQGLIYKENYKSRGRNRISVSRSGLRVDIGKVKGLFALIWDFWGFPKLFSHWKCGGQGSRGYRPWRGSRSTIHGGPRLIPLRGI